MTLPCFYISILVFLYNAYSGDSIMIEQSFKSVVILGLLANIYQNRKINV